LIWDLPITGIGLCVLADYVKSAMGLKVLRMRDGNWWHVLRVIIISMTYSRAMTIDWQVYFRNFSHRKLTSPL